MFLAVLALLALLGNVFVVQTHIHSPHPGFVIGHLADAAPSVTTVDDACALCDALAAFEPYLPAGPAVLPALRMVATIVSPVTPTPLHLHARGHAWQSRAPPNAPSI